MIPPFQWPGAHRLRRMRTGFARASLALLAAAAAASPVGGAREAYAEESVHLPFIAGQAIRIIQGYNGGTHQGRSHYGLDLVLATGKTDNVEVLAPINGKVNWAFAPGAGAGCIAITTPSDQYTVNLCHVILHRKFDVGEPITRGQSLGIVGPAGTVENNGVAHIHMELHRGASTSSGIPFNPPEGLPLEGVSLPSSGEYSEHANIPPIVSTNSPTGQAPAPANQQPAVERSTQALTTTDTPPPAEAQTQQRQAPPPQPAVPQSQPAEAASPAEKVAAAAPETVATPLAAATTAAASVDEPESEEAAVAAVSPGVLQRTAVIIGTNSCLNVREEPSLDAAAVDCLADGTEVPLATGTIEAEGQWWRQVDGSGWVASEYLRQTVALVVDTGSCLNIREEPSTDAEVVDCIEDGTLVRLTEGPHSEGDYNWYRIEDIGWAVSDYLD